jgi:hypothetical protein
VPQVYLGPPTLPSFNAGHSGSGWSGLDDYDERFIPGLVPRAILVKFFGAKMSGDAARPALPPFLKIASATRREISEGRLR